MARDLSAGSAAAANAAVVKPVIFYEGEFEGGFLRYWSGLGSIDWNGQTWTGVGMLLGIAPIEELSDIRAAAFHVSLSGVVSANLSAVLGQSRNGLPGKVWLGFFEQDHIEFDFTRKTIDAVVGAALAPVTFTRSGATATRVNEQGLIETVAANTPRFDHDPVTLACRGLLIEEARTNLCLRSNEFTTAPWSSVGGGASPVQNVPGPDGGASSAWTFTDDDAGAWEERRQTFVVANDALPHVFSILVGKTVGAGNTFGVNFNLSGGSTPVSLNTRLNTNTGNTSGGGVAASWNDDFWLFYGVVTNNATGNTTLSIAIYPATGNNSGANPGGDTVAAVGSAVVFGAQVEKAAFPSSYIPTTAASVTRSADVATVADISGFYNASEGTLVAEFSTGDATGPVSGTFMFASLDDGGTNERMQFRATGSNSFDFLVLDGGAVQAVVGSTSLVARTTYRAAATYKANDFAASVGGGAVTTDVSGTLPTVTTLGLGCGGGGFSQFNGHLRRLTYYPRRLTNAQLEQLSAGFTITGADRLVADPFLAFEGRFDVPEILDEGETAVITARYESRLIDLDRVRARRYTDEDQKLEFPNDRGFEYVPKLQDKDVFWGAPDQTQKSITPRSIAGLFSGTPDGAA